MPWQLPGLSACRAPEAGAAYLRCHATGRATYSVILRGSLIRRGRRRRVPDAAPAVRVAGGAAHAPAPAR